MSRHVSLFLFVYSLLVVTLCVSACDPPLYSFEGGDTQGWVGAQPPSYSGSASQAAVYSEPQHATDGQYSLRVAFDYFTQNCSNAVYYVEALNYDFSAYSTLDFDIWKTGQPYSLTVSLSTGSSWVWYESKAYSISDGQSYVSIDLTSSDWKSQSSNWVNNIPVQDINAVHRIAVILLPSSTGFNEAFLDNFRVCGASTATTGSSVATTGTGTSTGLTVSTSGASSTTGPVTSGFVTVRGNIFLLNGCQYYIHGTNTYYLTYWGNLPVQHVFDDCVSMGLNTLRTWAFLETGSLDGSRANVDGPKNGVYFQYWNDTTKSVVFNDGSTGLQNLDYVVYQAKLRGVRLILTLTNNWKDFGGADQYCVWFNKTNHDQFYTDVAIKRAYKQYAYHLVNRVNTYTGISYKNEPTILAWELINEPRCANGNLPTSGTCTTATISRWVDEMSTYIHSIDPNHMISVGDEGFFNNSAYGSDWKYDGSTGDYHSYTSNPHISFGTAHLYPSYWGEAYSWGSTWISQHIQDITTKPFLLEEFGIPDKNSRASVYANWTNTLKSGPGAGFTYWMLASNLTGSLYPDYDGFTVYNDASGGAAAIRNANAYYQGLENSCASTTSSSSSTTGKASSSKAATSLTSASTKAASTTGAASTKTASYTAAASTKSASTTGIASTKSASTTGVASTKSVSTTGVAATKSASTTGVASSKSASTTGVASTKSVSTTGVASTKSSSTTAAASTQVTSTTAGVSTKSASTLAATSTRATSTAASASTKVASISAASATKATSTTAAASTKASSTTKRA